MWCRRTGGGCRRHGSLCLGGSCGGRYRGWPHHPPSSCCAAISTRLRATWQLARCHLWSGWDRGAGRRLAQCFITSSWACCMTTPWDGKACCVLGTTHARLLMPCSATVPRLGCLSGSMSAPAGVERLSVWDISGDNRCGNRGVAAMGLQFDAAWLHPYGASCLAEVSLVLKRRPLHIMHYFFVPGMSTSDRIAASYYIFNCRPAAENLLLRCRPKPWWSLRSALIWTPRRYFP